jgi:anti-anti-sigma factor
MLMMPGLPLRPEAHGMACIDVALAEDLDLATAPLVRSWLQVAVDANPGGTLRVDLSSTSVLDEPALAVLVGVLLGMRETGGEVVLINVGPAARSTLQLTRLDRVFGFGA